MKKFKAFVEWFKAAPRGHQIIVGGFILGVILVVVHHLGVF